MSDAVHADDELLDVLGSGQPAPDDAVTEVLVAWRDDVDAAPIPAPPGKHARRGMAERVDRVRHWLLYTMVGPLDPDEDGPLGGLRAGSARAQRRREWRAIGAALGDVAEDIAGWFLIAVAGLVLVGTTVLAVIAAPWWLRLLVLAAAGFGAAMVVSLRRAARKLDEITASLDDLLDGESAR